MPANMIGQNRTSAIWRLLVGAAFLFFILPVVVPILIIAFVILGLADIILQFATDGSGGRIPLIGLTERVWDWGFDNLIWAFTGKGSFELMP